MGGREYRRSMAQKSDIWRVFRDCNSGPVVFSYRIVEVVRTRLRFLIAITWSSLYGILEIRHGQISSRKSVLLTKFEGSQFADSEMAHFRGWP